MITPNYFGMVTICAGIFGVIKCQRGNCHFGHASLVALGAQLLTSYHFNWSTIHVSQLKILIEHTCLYRNYMRIHTCIKYSPTHTHKYTLRRHIAMYRSHFILQHPRFSAIQNIPFHLFLLFLTFWLRVKCAFTWTDHIKCIFNGMQLQAMNELPNNQPTNAERDNKISKEFCTENIG